MCAYMFVYLFFSGFERKLLNRSPPTSQQTYRLGRYGDYQAQAYNGEGGYWGSKSNIGRMGVKP